MGFYQDRVSLLRPVCVDDYGASAGWSWDLDAGASIIEVPYLVDFQPRAGSSENQSREIAITIYRLHTPPGKAFDFNVEDRLIWRSREFTLLGKLGVWSSAMYPSGIDHVEADFVSVGESSDG